MRFIGELEKTLEANVDKEGFLRGVFSNQILSTSIQKWEGTQKILSSSASEKERIDRFISEKIKRNKRNGRKSHGDKSEHFWRKVVLLKQLQNKIENLE
ncbi:MAG: hypothetical protein PHU61_00925 [Candidatus Absconditabacteria bacterium]|nr:hypothetical protein [Candidatus Absconditabacteria bacterium]MDD3868434.1 hypothetical protein [Candidatus Absconditabacteria bacterium]MDD4714042.1 hypothetical protein [Candidatus Absconditabacteria bacterium]